jgi:hypothetical protein
MEELVSWGGGGWFSVGRRGGHTLDDGRDGEGAAQDGGVLLAGNTDERLALRGGELAAGIRARA